MLAFLLIYQITAGLVQIVPPRQFLRRQGIDQNAPHRAGSKDFVDLSWNGNLAASHIGIARSVAF